jgi:hypothetical protein
MEVLISRPHALPSGPLRPTSGPRLTVQIAVSFYVNMLMLSLLEHTPRVLSSWSNTSRLPSWVFSQLLPVFFSPYSSTMKMEAIYASKTSGFLRYTRRYSQKIVLVIATPWGPQIQQQHWQVCGARPKNSLTYIASSEVDWHVDLRGLYRMSDGDWLHFIYFCEN